MNSIHNPDETLWNDIFPEENTYQIENFLDNIEINTLVDWFNHNKTKKGFYLQEENLQFIADPYEDPLVQEILFPKIEKIFGDFRLYGQIHNDINPHSADFICKQFRIFGPHTDAITHIPNWITFKDVIIPLYIDNDAEVYTYGFNQRCYRRGTHFRKGSTDTGLNVYSNVLRDNYDILGVKYLNGSVIDYDFIENHIGSRFPQSYFEGFTVNSIEKNIPGNAIIKDSSVIHGPSNYNLKKSIGKLNISLRIFKKIEKWQPNTVFSLINFESCNKRTYYAEL